MPFPKPDPATLTEAGRLAVLLGIKLNDATGTEEGNWEDALVNLEQLAGLLGFRLSPKEAL